MKRVSVFLMGLLTAATVTFSACGAPPKAEDTSPAATLACVNALDSSDQLLALTAKIMSDINLNDHDAFSRHFSEYRVVTEQYKEWRQKCLDGTPVG